MGITLKKISIPISGILLLATLVLYMLSLQTNAAVNQQVDYQGKLLNTSGFAVDDGSYNMEFKLYDVATGGTALWTETRTGADKVSVAGGIFSLMLGSVTSLSSLNFNQTLYLGINIGGTGSPSWDGEMTPRQTLGASPAVFEALQLEGVTWSAPAAIGGTTQNTGAFSTLGVGTQSPDATLEISAASPAFRMTNTGANEYLRIIKNDATTHGALQYNRIIPAGSIEYAEATVWSSVTGSAGEKGIQTFGDSSGRLVVQGEAIQGRSASRDYLRIDSSGHVGLGTDTPTVALDVVGSIRSVLTATYAPTQMSSISTTGNARGIAVAGSYAYVITNASDLFRIFDISNPASPIELGSASADANVQDIMIAGRYAYIVSYNNETLKIYDVSDPNAPVSVGSVGAGGRLKGVYVAGRYAYVTNETEDTLDIIDVGNPTSPIEVGSIATGLNPIGVFVRNKYAYVVTNSGNTLEAIDVSDPTQPSIADTVATDSAPSSVYVTGRYAYVTTNSGNTLQVFDVANPASIPAAVGSLATDAGAWVVHASGRYAYMIDNTSDSFQIIDISDPTTPVEVGAATIDDNPSDMTIAGRYAYITSFNSSTLKIYDLSGLETTAGLIHALETGTLHVGNDAVVAGRVTVGTGLNVGAGGVFSDGDIAAATTLYVKSRLGVGTTSPDFALDVAGHMRIESSGKLYFGDVITASAFTSDANTYLLLHTDGTDEGTTFTDSGQTGHTVTANGTANTETSTKIVGTASGQFDGDSDFLSITPHTDFDLGSNDFTIEAWVNLTALGSYSVFMGTMNTAGTTGWVFRINDTNGLRFDYHNGSLQVLAVTGWAPTLNTWYHVAVTRSSGNLYFFVDGVQIGATQSISGTITNSSDVGIARHSPANSNPNFFSGYIDELRFSKGTARYTSNFTPGNRPDTELYRSAADTLYTPDTFKAGGYQSSDGSAGVTSAVNTQNSGGASACAVTLKNGLVTATTCTES